MSPRPDIDALLPDDDTRRARREALVAELRPALAADGDVATDTATSTPHHAGTSVPRPGTAGSPVLTRRRLLRAGLIGGGALAIGLVGTTVIPGTDGSPVDVLGSARAAAAPMTGGILHTVIRDEFLPDLGPGHLASKPLDAPEKDQTYATIGHRTERWSTTEPLRDHVVRDVTLERTGEPAKEETSYDSTDGDYRRRLFFEQDVVHVTKLDAKGRAAQDRLYRSTERPSLMTIGESSDPVAVLRKLLDSDLLRPDGETTLNGRAVHRLVGRDPGRRRRTDTIEPTGVEVLVDADDFTPVRIRTIQVLPAEPDSDVPEARHERTNQATFTFERYERLPLNAENARLLRVDTTGRKVVGFDR